jgi:UDP-N-acetylglucosamine 2-epimerase (non-hydrolysing)
MPEEINRIVPTGSLIIYLPPPGRRENLRAEGVDAAKIHFVGNTMIDSLNYYLPRVKHLNLRDKYSIEERKFILVTLHRPSNVDNDQTLHELIQVLCQIQERMPIIFPMHRAPVKCWLNLD